VAAPRRALVPVERITQAILVLRSQRVILDSDLAAIYGVTTGFGDSAHRQISPSKTSQLQQNILRFMGVGTGPIAPPEVAPAPMTVWISSMNRIAPG